MTSYGWRFRKSDLELLRAAASREEISQSEFLRLAVRERAGRILAVSVDNDR